jgi:quinol monooxygenase YgiN
VAFSSSAQWRTTWIQVRVSVDRDPFRPRDAPAAHNPPPGETPSPKEHLYQCSTLARRRMMSVEGKKGRRWFLKAAGGALGAMAAWSGRTAGAENEVVTAVTLIRGLEGREEELEAHLLSLSAPTRAEPGCVMYDLYRSPGVKNHFLRLEVWASPAALEAHKATPHIRPSFEKRQREGWSTEISVWKRVG